MRNRPPDFNQQKINEQTFDKLRCKIASFATALKSSHSQQPHSFRSKVPTQMHSPVRSLGFWGKLLHRPSLQSSSSLFLGCVSSYSLIIIHCESLNFSNDCVGGWMAAKLNNIPSLTRRRAAIYTCGDKNTEYIGLGETHEANTPKKNRAEPNPIKQNLGWCLHSDKETEITFTAQ